MCLLSQKRFPFCLYFVVGVGDLWGMMGDSRFFCNHSVYPTGVPRIGNSVVSHSSECEHCRMALIFCFGAISWFEWDAVLSQRLYHSYIERNLCGQNFRVIFFYHHTTGKNGVMVRGCLP